MSEKTRAILEDTYDRGMHSGVTGITDFACGAWRTGRDALTDKVVADYVEEVAAAVSVGRFLASASRAAHSHSEAD